MMTKNGRLVRVPFEGLPADQRRSLLQSQRHLMWIKEGDKIFRDYISDICDEADKDDTIVSAAFVRWLPFDPSKDDRIEIALRDGSLHVVTAFAWHVSASQSAYAWAAFMVDSYSVFRTRGTKDIEGDADLYRVISFRSTDAVINTRPAVVNDLQRSWL